MGCHHLFYELKSRVLIFDDLDRSTSTYLIFDWFLILQKNKDDFLIEDVAI